MKKIYAIFAVFIFLASAGSTFAAVPTINMLAPSASDITNSSIVVTTSYKENGSNTEMYYEYTTDPGFGSGIKSIPSGFELVPTRGTGYFIKTITGLDAGTRYYIRARAANNDGLYTDPGISVTTTYTTYSTPKIETLNEENVTTSGMTLTGRVNTYGASGSAYYNFYSSNCSSLISTTGSTSLSATTGSQYVKTAVSGLSSNTKYCAELVATVNGSTYYGGKVSVQTTNSYTPTYTCSITSFYADATSLYAGNSTTIRWATSNCTSASLTNYGSVSLNSSQSTGALYSTTSYTLNAYGTNGNDSKTISIGVLPHGGCTYNCGGTPTTYPSCYYAGTCYWNGSYWVTVNNGCNYNCGGTPTTYPSCYYDNTCYQSNGNWYYKTSGNIVPYTYNPHTPVNNTTKYITNKLPNIVKTIYQDEQVVTNPVQYVQTSPYDYTSPVMYNSYNADDIMNRYGTAFYDYSRGNTVNGSLLTGSAGSVYGISLIELLLVLIVIALIVYLVRSNQNKDAH